MKVFHDTTRTENWVKVKATYCLVCPYSTWWGEEILTGSLGSAAYWLGRRRHMYTRLMLPCRNSYLFGTRIYSYLLKTRIVLYSRLDIWDKMPYKELANSSSAYLVPFIVIEYALATGTMVLLDRLFFSCNDVHHWIHYFDYDSWMRIISVKSYRPANSNAPG